MNPIVWTDVTDEAPELAVMSAGAQLAILDYVNTKLVVAGLDGEFGRKTFLARVFLAAHMATLIRRRGQAGALTSQSAGPVSESFALLPLARYGVYATTGYGLLLVSILASSTFRAGIVLGGGGTSGGIC